MNCRALAACVTAYLDGDLDDAEASACRGHLRTCPACRALAAEHATLRDELTGLDRPEPPSAMWGAISARLGEAEIADARRAPASRLWDRWLAKVRPMLVPVGVTVSACAIAVAVVQVRRAPARQVMAIRAPAPIVEPAPLVPLRDAADELADEAKRIDDKFRRTTADLLELARAEIEHAPAAQAKLFALELARREKAVLSAESGAPREKAWHALTSYLETVAVGQQLALGGPS